MPVCGLALHVTLVMACASSPDIERVEATRLSRLTHIEDAQWRASLDLVLVGLDADAAGQGGRAVVMYQRAIQVDATNPYAYLALARHWIEAGQPQRGIRLLDQAEVLLESRGEDGHGTQVHLVGLRGRAAVVGGSPESAADLLQRAAAAAPEVWGDGILSADELR
jgi:hypothetical protein